MPKVSSTRRRHSSSSSNTDVPLPPLNLPSTTNGTKRVRQREYVDVTCIIATSSLAHSFTKVAMLILQPRLHQKPDEKAYSRRTVRALLLTSSTPTHINKARIKFFCACAQSVGGPLRRFPTWSTIENDFMDTFGMARGRHTSTFSRSLQSPASRSASLPTT
jgi:hypothetical protein